ncbi:shikimate kinase [Pseudactinotalea suaedae]|uniref:shikimate kinase n=1 Tax=Pseudactinotalea suaedae TaxID=1524924 RepID=UPI0012E2CFE6|nr:shikimate kinase [Pseudactinotalea suaedae]
MTSNPSAQPGPAVIVIGLPGAGKSTVGQLLADALGVGFRDTDADVEAAAGESISDIFLTHGEERFRALERAAVVAALAEHDGVLALGGGAILDAHTQADLAGHRVVHLQVSLAAASPRVGLSAARPLLVGSPRKQWLELAEARRPVYTALAQVTVDTDGKTPEEVVEQVLLGLGER